MFRIFFHIQSDSAVKRIFFFQVIRVLHFSKSCSNLTDDNSAAQKLPNSSQLKYESNCCSFVLCQFRFAFAFRITRYSLLFCFSDSFTNVPPHSFSPAQLQSNHAFVALFPYLELMKLDAFLTQIVLKLIYSGPIPLPVQHG